MTPVAEFITSGRSGIPLLISALCLSPNRLNSGSPGKGVAVCLGLILITDSTPGAWMEGSPKVSKQTPKPRGLELSTQAGHSAAGHAPGKEPESRGLPQGMILVETTVGAWSRWGGPDRVQVEGSRETVRAPARVESCPRARLRSAPCELGAQKGLRINPQMAPRK